MNNPKQKPIDKLPDSTIEDMTEDMKNVLEYLKKVLELEEAKDKEDK